MRAKPQTTFNDLITKLNEIKLSGSASSELELARLKREAEKLRLVDQADGLTALGIIACFEHRVAEMHSYHRGALAQSNDPLYAVNYAVSLLTCGLWEEALSYAKLVYAQAETDLKLRCEALDTMIITTHQLQLEEEFLDYAMEWEALTGKPHELFDSKTDEEEERLPNASIDAVDRTGFVRLEGALFRKAIELTEGH